MYRSLSIFAGMDGPDSPELVAFAQAGELAELWIVLAIKVTEMLALARQVPEARERIEAADQLTGDVPAPAPRIEPRGDGPTLRALPGPRQTTVT